MDVRGRLPGSPIETVRGRRLRIAGENHLTGIIPVTAVGFDLVGGPSPDLLSYYPCTKGFREVPGVVDLEPCAAVRLNGMLTDDGNALTAAHGGVGIWKYPNLVVSPTPCTST